MLNLCVKFCKWIYGKYAVVEILTSMLSLDFPWSKCEENSAFTFQPKNPYKLCIFIYMYILSLLLSSYMYIYIMFTYYTFFIADTRLSFAFSIAATCITGAIMKK